MHGRWKGAQMWVPVADLMHHPQQHAHASSIAASITCASSLPNHPYLLTTASLHNSKLHDNATMPVSNSDAMPLSFCIPYTAQPGSCPYWVLAR